MDTSEELGAERLRRGEEGAAAMGAGAAAAPADDWPGETRLPLVGKYSVPHLVRACSAARQFVDGVLLEVSPAAWQRHLRVMHDDRTTNQFNFLEVHSHDDATAMLRTVVQSARAFYSSRVATPFGRASFIDLPCQVCELAGVLGSVKAHRGALAHAGAIRDRLDDVDWLLARLPGSGSGIKKMSKSAKLRSSRILGRGNGMDLQCAGHVTKRWLRSNPLRLRSSLLDVCGAGRGGPFRLPRVLCLTCSCVLDGDLNNRLALCTVCRLRRRRIWGCGAAANQARHVSQEHPRRRCRDCGVATAVSDCGVATAVSRLRC